MRKFIFLLLLAIVFKAKAQEYTSSICSRFIVGGITESIIQRTSTMGPDYLTGGGFFLATRLMVRVYDESHYVHYGVRYQRMYTRLNYNGLADTSYQHAFRLGGLVWELGYTYRILLNENFVIDLIGGFQPIIYGRTKVNTDPQAGKDFEVLYDDNSIGLALNLGVAWEVKIADFQGIVLGIDYSNDALRNRTYSTEGFMRFGRTYFSVAFQFGR